MNKGLTPAIVAGLLLSLTVSAVLRTYATPDEAGWTVGTLPADWERIRNRWEFYHGLRTAPTLVGAGCLFASALWTHHGQRDLRRAALRAA